MQPMTLIVGSALVATLVLLVLDLGRERRRILAYVRSLAPLSEVPMERVLAVAARIGNRHVSRVDPFYLSPILGPLGGSVSDLIAQGGCCSGASRLYMLALEALGIRANQITVHHWKGHAQHCLVEVHLPEGPTCVDPVYGLYYTDGSGRPLGLDDLQAGAAVHCQPIPGAQSPGYPENDYYAFDYELTRTANWTRSWSRRAAYALLRAISGSRVDRMRVPQLLEWPQNLLALLILGAACAGSGALIVSRFVLS